MHSKRSISQRSNSSGIRSQTKRQKTFDSNRYFQKTLRESGLNLKQLPEKCIASQETIHIIRNIKRSLEKHLDYPRNVSELFSNLEKECQDIDVFKYYLYPNIVRVVDDDSDEYPVNDSVLKILLSIPIIQNKLIDYIFEKAIDLAANSNCGPWIQMILKNFSSLDNIVNSEKISTNLINLLDITTEKMVRLEIITAIPDIIGDQEHNNISNEMSRILCEDHDLIPAILECLTYLCLSDEQYELLQKKALNILMSLSKCNYFPNFIKFLLIPGRMSDSAYLEAVQGLRNALAWPTSIAKPQDIATSQVLTATAIRNSMILSKINANSWLKVVSSCKINTDHKPIDFIILLILFSTSEDKQKQVENFMKKQIKLDILKEDLLDEVFEKYKSILRDNLKNLIELTNLLLKTKTDPTVESFGTHLYTLMLSELDDCCQTVVAELLQLCLDSKQCVMSILLILNNVAVKDMCLLKPQSVQMMTLLDRMDDMPLTEIRAVMNLLCGLAYSYQNSIIRDDIHMIIRKELGSSNPKIKIQGILAGIHAVKYLMACDIDDDKTKEMPDDISYSSVTHLAEGDLREAAQIIELISRSTRQSPDMVAFFYDELSKVVSSNSPINKKFMAWLTEAVTNDLQQNFIVDSLEAERISNLKLSMQYCLNAENEMDEVIAINIAGLTLQPTADICVSILSPLFQLVQTLHHKQHEGDLSSIDAILGCPIVMPQFDVDLIEDMDRGNIANILDCLIHCINWFRELVNGFAHQKHEELIGKLLKRVHQIEELELLICEILMKSKISYKPPVCFFSIQKYTGEPAEKKIIKAQFTKQKPTKKTAQDDTVLPETARSQATQNNLTKTKFDSAHNINFRKLNLSILHLLKMDLSNENEPETEFTVITLKFLLKSVNNNLEEVLISKIKRKSFLSKQDDIVYDANLAEDCAKSVCEVLPNVKNHLQLVTSFIENHTATNTQNDNSFIYTSEILEYLLCLEYIYNMLTIYFKWIGFRNHRNSLLKTSLKSIVSTEASSESLKDLLMNVAKKFQNHEKYCLQLSTAVALIEFMQAIQNYSDNKIMFKMLRNMAENFLSQQWKTPDGGVEKGLQFNQRVDRLTSIYLVNNEILSLKNLMLELTSDIAYLKTRNDTLKSLKCFNKNNFSILYRNLGTSVYEATKTKLNKGMTNSEHLEVWKDVAIILKYMSDIAKTLENRNNLSAFFKKSFPILKLFLTHGIPIMELQFKSETQEVLEILKVLQQSTRFLQSLCCHSRLKKDSVLMSKVPFMRQLLETLIYKVKAALAANNCSEAFWMGNLKNKNLQGEVIASQQSIEDDDTVEDDDDHLPEDDESIESDEDVLNPDSASLSDIV